MKLWQAKMGTVVRFKPEVEKTHTQIWVPYPGHVIGFGVGFPDAYRNDITVVVQFAGPRVYESGRHLCNSYTLPDDDGVRYVLPDLLETFDDV